MGQQNDIKRDLTILGIPELDSKDYLSFCLRQVQNSKAVWNVPFFRDSVLHKYEIPYFGKFILNIFIIEDNGQKFFLEFFAALNTEKYYKASNVEISYDRKDEPALVTAAYNIGDIYLTGHITNYDPNQKKINEIVPSFIGLAGRIVPHNAIPTKKLMTTGKDVTPESAEIIEIIDKLNADEYFSRIDSFLIPTAVLKNLDPIRNKNNWDILAPILSVEYIEQSATYILELDFIDITIPMAIPARDIFDGVIPQIGARFHGVAWGQCRVR